MWLSEGEGPGTCFAICENVPKGHLILQPSSRKFCSYSTAEDKKRKPSQDSTEKPKMRKEVLSDSIRTFECIGTPPPPQHSRLLMPPPRRERPRELGTHQHD